MFVPVVSVAWRLERTERDEMGRGMEETKLVKRIL